MQTIDCDIAGNRIALDRQAAYELACMLSELHGRVCSHIGSCGDMDEATDWGKTLFGLSEAHGRVIAAANSLPKD